MKRVVVEKGSYYDSVFLMLINKEIRKIANVSDAAVAMGTEMNIELLKKSGFFNADMDELTPNDLIIAVAAVDDKVAQSAIQVAKDLLTKKRIQAAEARYRPASLDAAVKMLPDANLVIVSVPGAFAVREARKALEKGLHVMLFSDNVSLQDEVKLKELGRERRLLMMGPDCGTAIINGKPLCFANKVRRGKIGIVGASGTGMQEVSCHIDKRGGGISQAIGTGGRDLQSSYVGGMMTLAGIEALKNDPETQAIVVISKPPAEQVADSVISAVRKTGKPSVVHFIGAEPMSQEKHLRFAGNLEEAADMAVALLKGEEYSPHELSISSVVLKRLVEIETSKMGRKQKYLRGLFTGGSLADEAMIVLEKGIGDVYSNNQTKSQFVLEDPTVSYENTVIDFGGDVFTVGRPHPMIDPSLREERILKEMEDPEAAVMLLDLVLGYGSHADPAGAILESLERAKRRAEQRGGHLSIVTSITGTEADYQDIVQQKQKLEHIGCVVMPSNYQASMLACELIKRVA